ncbi:MAG: resolvase [bacterium]|nr:resolvase [Candidatus Margulisiibacteriota bacterium]
MILAIDPGKNKCGLAAFDQAGNLLKREIVPRNQIMAEIQKYSPKKIIIGQSANGYQLEKELKGKNYQVVLVDEKNSSLEARKLYWQDHPPQGLWNLIPRALQITPVLIDDYAAVILGERYLKN